MNKCKVKEEVVMIQIKVGIRVVAMDKIQFEFLLVLMGKTLIVVLDKLQIIKIVDQIMLSTPIHKVKTNKVIRLIILMEIVKNNSLTKTIQI